MTAYIIRRVLLMIPTVFGIMLVSFVVVQFAPGGPVERIIAQLSGTEARFCASRPPCSIRSPRLRGRDQPGRAVSEA